MICLVMLRNGVAIGMVRITTNQVPCTIPKAHPMAPPECGGVDRGATGLTIVERPSGMKEGNLRSAAQMSAFVLLGQNRWMSEWRYKGCFLNPLCRLRRNDTGGGELSDIKKRFQKL